MCRDFFVNFSGNTVCSAKLIENQINSISRMSDKFLISKMLNNLENTRISIARQNVSIAEVIDKSNNVLLQIEASRGLKPATNDSKSTPYTYNKETVNALTRVVDKFISILKERDQPVETRNFDEYLDAAGQRADYLGCNIRKLLAIWDTIQQMRIGLERQELEFASEETEIEE